MLVVWLERVTGVLSSTISVPDTAIAEYSPTVTVNNITGATPVNFTTQPICERFINVQIWCSFHFSVFIISDLFSI